MDLVERLRDYSEVELRNHNALAQLLIGSSLRADLKEAADEIKRQRKEILNLHSVIELERAERTRP